MARQVFSYSNFRKEGVVGDTTAEALAAKDVRWAKVKEVKAPVGVPAEPGPDLGIEYRSEWQSHRTDCVLLVCLPAPLVHHNIGRGA